jgi:hypothetical protein
MRARALLVLLTTWSLCGCSAEAATLEQCRAIFDRLVTLELEEMGFRDGALVELTRAQLSARHQHEITQCVGRRLPPHAMSCVTAAKNAETVSHECLR